MDWSGFEPEAFPVQGGRYTRFNYQPPKNYEVAFNIIMNVLCEWECKSVHNWFSKIVIIFVFIIYIYYMCTYALKVYIIK